MQCERAPCVKRGERQNDITHYQFDGDAVEQAAHQRVLGQKNEFATGRVVNSRRGESDEEEAARLERKLRLFRGPLTGKKFDDKKIASLYRTLLRAGFSSDTIRRELRRLTHEDLPDPEPANDEL